MDGDLVTMFWIRSERESKSPNPAHREVDARYDAAARAVGVLLTSISVDDVVVGATSTGPAVRVRGSLVAPDSAFFHTKLMTWPTDRFDSWRHLTTYAAVSAAGFFTSVPVGHSLINNDKMLTALRLFAGDVPRLPTVRLCTRGYGTGHLDSCGAAIRASNIAFPVIVKPSSWGAGHSVFVADTLDDLDTVLSWAAAAELTVVVQPWLGRNAADCRVYCVDGEPYRALVRRPVGDAVAGNPGQGGVAQLTDVPEALVCPARTVARDIGLPYVCVDFLGTDGRWWFSEIEIDGGTNPGERHLTEVRFGSYRSRFDAFVRNLSSGGAR